MLRYLLVSSVAASLLAGAAVYVISLNLPNVAAILEESKSPVVTICDARGSVMAKYGDLHGKTLRYQKIPHHLIDALVATEDRRFFRHFGLDFIGILRASYANQRAGKFVQGGSTITQQLAKITLLTPERTLHRKIQEALLAIKIEDKFSKQEIIEMYLNRVYLGRGNFGIDAAARFYFGKPAEDINLHEAAILVGMLKSPNRFSPANNKDLSLKRAKQVLYKMEDAGYINLTDLKNLPEAHIIQRGAQRGMLHEPYFTDYVMEILPQLIGPIERNLTVNTTLDLVLQNRLEQAVKRQMSHHAKSRKATQAAAVTMDDNGAIKAWVGGTSYAQSQFDRVYQARRQPGSSFKIFVYLAALNDGMNLSDTLVDHPISINGWRPRNFSRDYRGKMTMLDAFAQSINTIAVQLSEQVGRNKVIAMARSLGINTAMPSLPSIALGTAEVSLLDMTSGYASISARGHALVPVAVTSVYNQRGQVIYSKIPSPGVQVLTDNVVRASWQLLSHSVNDGTSHGASMATAQAYGKTGTTQDHRDAWFFGFSGGLTTGVWLGNDDDRPMDRLTGGQLPAAIWKQFMTSTPVTIEKPKTSFWKKL